MCKAASPFAGFIISSVGQDGTVVTNTHIIADAIGADSASASVILCTLQDGRSFQAQLVNFDWSVSKTGGSARS
jgi:S1-C subfamily serine protease